MQNRNPDTHLKECLERDVILLQPLELLELHPFELRKRRRDFHGHRQPPRLRGLLVRCLRSGEGGSGSVDEKHRRPGALRSDYPLAAPETYTPAAVASPMYQWTALADRFGNATKSRGKD